MIKSLFGKVELSIGDSYFGPVILLLTIQNKTKKKPRILLKISFLVAVSTPVFSLLFHQHIHVVSIKMLFTLNMLF